MTDLSYKLPKKGLPKKVCLPFMHLVNIHDTN